jgi:hypothetical protein
MKYNYHHKTTTSIQLVHNHVYILNIDGGINIV